jgi:hypothetical protein
LRREREYENRANARASPSGGANWPRLGYAILDVVVIVATAAGVIPADDLHVGAYLGGVVVWTLAGAVLGAPLGAFFQAIANAALRRAAREKPSSD